MATAMNMNMGYDAQNTVQYPPQCCSCSECHPCAYPGSSAPPSPTPSQSNWWVEEICEDQMNRVAPPARGPTPPMARENYSSQRFQPIDRSAHQWGNHSQQNMNQQQRVHTPRNTNTPPPHPHTHTHHNIHHSHSHSNMHSNAHMAHNSAQQQYPYGERRSSYGCGYTQPHKPASYAHLPIHHHHNQGSPMVPRAHTPGPAVMGGVSTHPNPVTRRNSMPLPNKYPAHMQNHAAPVVPGSGPQEASRIRFVNAKCWRHDPYSETAYRAEPKTPLTCTTFADVEEVVETETNDSVIISPRNGSPQPLTVASDDDVRPSFSHSSSFSDFSIGPVDENRKTFTEEELINNPDEVVATPGNTTDEDGCCWVEVLVGSDGVRKRRYRFSGVLPCGHRAFAKRLRYRRGWTYFMCVSCGFKWGESGVR